MDTNTAIVVSVAFVSLVVMSAYFVALTTAVTRREQYATRIAAHDHAQVQINRASDTATLDAGGVTKTDIQVYEDALAKLAATNDVIATCHEIVEAAKSGLFRGDLVEHLEGLLHEARSYTELGAFILQRGRTGEYAYRTTEGDLEETRGTRPSAGWAGTRVPAGDGKQ
jgi:hypothetical protein